MDDRSPAAKVGDADARNKDLRNNGGSLLGIGIHQVLLARYRK